MKKVLFLILSIVFLFQSYGQQTIVVANGTTTNTYLPVYGYMMDVNQHNQLIYPASHISSLSGVLILKMSFNGNPTVTNNWGGATAVISLATTPDSNFVNPDFDTTALTQVYSGPISVVNGIMTIQFTIPFLYQGGNLLVDIVTTTNGDYETMTFFGVASNNAGLNLLEYDTYPTMVSFLPRNTIEYVIGTPIVLTHPASNVLEQSATLNGSFYNLTSTNYGFQYRLSSTTDWTNATTVQATTNPMHENINNLTPNTEYIYRAFASDGSNIYYGSSSNFTTIPTPDTLPYLCNFEDTLQNDRWILANGTEINQWFIGAPGSNGPLGNGLYISDDNGVTANYDSTGASLVMASTYIHFNDAYEFTLSFDWLGMGGYWEGYVEAYLVPVNYTLTPGTMIPYTYSVTSQLMGYSSWQHYTALLGSQYSNNTYQLVFLWYNESFGFGTNPPGMVDNIAITPLSCPTPTNLAFSNLGTSSVQLTWSHATSASEFLVSYQVEGDTTWTTISVSDTTVMLSNLTSATVYNAYITAVCSSADTSYSTFSVNFTTLCNAEIAPTAVETFMNVLPSSCWSIKTGFLPATGNAILNDAQWGWDMSFTFATPTISVNMYSDECQYWLLSPSIDLGTGSTLFQLDFDIARTAYGSSSIGNLHQSPNARFVVLISTDNGLTWNNTGILLDWNNSTGTPFTTINNTLQTQSIPLYDSVAMAPYTGVVRFAFYAYENDPNYIYDNDLHIDNFQVIPYNSCLKPTNLIATNITLNSIDLGWTANGSATQWQIEYGPSGFTHGNGTFLTVSNNPYTVPGLTSATTYDFYVRSICGAGDTSYWSSMISAATSCPPATLPFAESFNTSQFPPCWTQTKSGSIESLIWSVQDYGAAGGTGYEMITEMYFGYGVSRLISPPIDFTGAPYALLTFKQLYLDEDGVTTLKIQTSPDLINWTDQPYTYTVSGGLVGPETASLVMSVPAGVNYVAWVIDGDHELIGWAVDDITIEVTTEPCVEPFNLQVNSVTSFSAVATWSPGGAESSWIVEYKVSTAANWTSATTSTPTFTMNGLQSNANYLVRVKAVCTEGESDFTPEVSFYTTVGIDENILNQSVDLYPNPTSSILSIKVNKDDLLIQNGKVFDMYGKLINGLSIQNEITQIEVASLAPGVYFIRLETNQGTINKKFVKR